MARYIDADRFKQVLADLYDYAKWDPREIHFSLFDMVGNIDGEPTADVAPVVHAHWINHFDDLYPVESTVECSNCHEEQMVLLDDNYCPNCGAKMDEKEEG